MILAPAQQQLPIDISQLDLRQRTELDQLLDELLRRSKMRMLAEMFPDTGPLRRELYQKHLEFFAAGARYKERGFIAANRVGKTMGAGTEWTYHLTGKYPHWWIGHRFNHPIKLLVSGDTHETTRDILQVKLLGARADQPEKFGTGLVPGMDIKSVVRRPHVPGAVELARIAHVSGGESEIWFRSYVQGREIFQGFELHGFWPDEECPEDVYTEGLVRLMTHQGLCTLTFTPLQGITPLVQNLMDPSKMEEANRYIVQCGWDDVPHLDQKTKDQLFAKLPPHQRDARTKGIPSLGAGAIYPVLEEDITINDFLLPPHFHRGYGMDVGWNRTAASFGAYDRDSDILYAYSEHYRGLAEPPVHAQAILARGRWLTGAIDPAARGRSQADGMQLFTQYKGQGLNLVFANNGVESGIYETWMRLSTGRLKIFKSCQNTLAEYRIYRRDDKGAVVKQNDHLMDALRYMVMTMNQIMRPMPVDRPMFQEQEVADVLDPYVGY